MTGERTEAGARRYLRLFPAWMRADRGEEALGLVLDQVSADADRLPIRSRVDLVRAGLHARRRGTPPARVRRIVMKTPSSWIGDAGAVPVEWRPWLIAALQTRSLEWRCALAGNPFGFVGLSLLLVNRPPAAWLWPLVGTIAGIWLLHGVGWMVFRRQVWRQRVLIANGLGDDGRPLPPDQVTVRWTRAVIDNLWILPGAGAIALGAIVGAPLAWLQLRSGEPVTTPSRDAAAALAMIAVVGVLTGWWARRQVDRASGPEPTPATPPITLWTTPMVISVLASLCLGAAGAATVILATLLFGLHLLGVAAGPVAGLVILATALVAEHRVGRRIGLWEIRPWWAPQRIVRRLQDLPPPPATPDRPAFG